MEFESTLEEAGGNGGVSLTPGRTECSFPLYFPFIPPFWRTGGGLGSPTMAEVSVWDGIYIVI